MTKQEVNEMTENPFKYISDGWTIWDNQGQSIGMMQATNILNKLHQEKQAYLTEIRRLEEENKQLKIKQNDRFIIDDAGTLIDMTNGNNYDYVDEVCPLLNELNTELNDVELTCTDNRFEFDRDELHFRDRHIRVDLKNRDLKILINLPKYNRLFHYTVTGKTLTETYEEYKK